MALPVDAVFAFYADAHNLERITPPFLRFRIVAMSTPAIAEGTVIDYRLRLHGVPVGWRSLIESWRPPHAFVDCQLRGPYALWHHTHEFEAQAGGTVVRDRVRYRLPGGAAGALLGSALVRRDLAAIFAYRRTAIERLLLPSGDRPGVSRSLP